MDYDKLVDLIIAYTNRSEPTFIAIIPNLISQAMNRIYSQAKTLGFQKTDTGNTTNGVPIIQKPNDFKSPINLKIITNLGPKPRQKFLESRSYEFCIEYSPVVSTLSEPKFYSTDLNVPQVDTGFANIYLSPTPDANYTYELTYLSFPPVFNSTVSRNFLTDKYPNLLIYACMVEAIPYLKSDERVNTFTTLYREALQDVNADSQSRYVDRTTERSKD